MSDETTSVEPTQKGGISRRAALRAGVATGVGVAAWSGVTITSLGGTPAYGVNGCTGSFTIDLSAGCRNTDQGTCTSPFRYHELKTVSAPFSIDHQIGEGTCCDATGYPGPNQPTLKWTTTGISCVVYFEAWQNGQPSCRNSTGTNVAGFPKDALGKQGPFSDGSVGVPIPLWCWNLASWPSPTFYKIYAKCASEGSPPDCFGPGYDPGATP